MSLGGHKQENDFWMATLHNLAARFGVDAQATTRADLRRPTPAVESRRQHPAQRGHPIGSLPHDPIQRVCVRREVADAT